MQNKNLKPVFTLEKGTLPLLISIPHVGTAITAEVLNTMTPVAKRLDDTDWHLDRLYDFYKALDASILMAQYSRYVIDLNRAPDGINLYPGQNTTALCPTDTFNEEPLYLVDCAPNAAAIENRRLNYWQPYHEALAKELKRLKSEHGYVLLWEAHSIRSQVPRFFAGRLPDFSFGTHNNKSAMPGLVETLLQQLDAHQDYHAVANQRFKGGYITRNYGDPKNGIHAIQLELAQITYMEEQPPYRYDETKANKVKKVIQEVIETALDVLQNNHF